MVREFVCEALKERSQVSFSLTLQPCESSFLTCPHCKKVGGGVSNTKEGPVTVLFDSDRQVLHDTCRACGTRFVWKPGEAVVTRALPN